MAVRTYSGGGSAAGAVISADTQSSKWQGTLKKINSGMDVSSFTKEEVAKGEWNGARLEYQFPTGKQTYRRYDDNRSTWSFTTGFTKIADDGSVTAPAETDWAINNKVEWQELFGLGVTFYLEADAFVLMEGFVEIHTPPNNENGKIYNLTTSGGLEYRKVPSIVKVFVDGTVQDETIGYAFEERDWSTILANEPNPDGNISATGYGPSKYRPYQIQFGEALLKGWHHLQIKVDTRNERTYASARNFCVECIYTNNKKEGNYVIANFPHT